MISLKEFLTVAIWFVILCVAIMTFDQWRKFLRDSLRATGGGEHSNKWRKVGRRRTRIGVYLTWSWVFLFIAVSLLTAKLLDEANEWGDWAAGLAAPLAFGWLVLGYLQQTQESDSNAKSLASSVEKQNKLLEAAQRQAAASEAAIRPWLGLAPPQAVSVRFTASNVGVTVQYGMRNAGNSPAHHVRLTSVVLPIGPDGGDSSRLLESARAEADQGAGHWSGQTIFPGETQFHQRGDYFGHEQLLAADGSTRLTEVSAFILAVCLDYQFANGGRGRTQQVFTLYRTTEDGQTRLTMPVLPGDYAPASLKIGGLFSHMFLD